MRGAVPVVRRRQLLKAMQMDASVLPEADLLQKWSNTRRWALQLDAPKA